VSALSTKTWKNLKLATYIVLGSLLGSTFLYVVIKKLVKALKKRSHTELEDEVEDSDRIDSAGKDKQ